MATVDHTPNTSQAQTLFGALAAYFHDLFTARPSVATPRTAEETSLADRIEDLIDTIDNGFLIEETGEHAKLPQFAKSYLKTIARSGDA